jgi:hypothetical protein
MKSLPPHPIDLGQQVNIFSDDVRQLHFAELCNALYERELSALAQRKFNNISLLQRQIGGLKHYIKRAAYQFLQPHPVLVLDSHNASWQHKQAAHCPAKLEDFTAVAQWFAQQHELGIAVAVHINTLGNEHIELDSIDRIDSEAHTLHLNKFGWFTQDGKKCEAAQSANVQVQLLKPNKAVMVAACCGHSWNHKGKTQPHTLSLRELMLSFGINWKTFR